MTKLVHLPVEILTNIVALADLTDLPNLAQTSKLLYDYAIPRIWNNIKMDLTGSCIKHQNDLSYYDVKTTEKLMKTILNNEVSAFSLSNIKSLSFNLNPNNNSLFFEYFLDLNLLSNLNELTIHNNNVSLKQLKYIMKIIKHSKKNLQSINIYGISLSNLIEISLPPHRSINENIKSISISYSSVKNNKSSDIILLSRALRLLPNLESFSIQFNEYFDLCDDLSLEEKFFDLFKNMNIYNRKVKNIAIYDFPPYLHFSPMCLPYSLKSFSFHTNEIADESLFFNSLLQSNRRNLRSLSIRIVQSIDNSTKLEQINNIHSLNELILDTPSVAALLPVLIGSGNMVKKLAISNFNTSLLINLFKLSCSLSQLIVYSFSNTASENLPFLLIKSIFSTSKFGKLRHLFLPHLDDENFKNCFYYKKYSKHSSKVRLIINQKPHTMAKEVEDSVMAEQDYLVGPTSSIESPPLSPMSFSDDFFDNEVTISKNNNRNNELFDIKKSKLFQSVDEIDLFNFHYKYTHLCVL